MGGLIYLRRRPKVLLEYARLNLHLWPLRDALSWAVNWERPMGKLQSELIINPGRVTLECAMLRVPLWRGTNWEQP